MGMYTEIFFRAELRRDTPEEVIEQIKWLVEGDGPLPQEWEEHPFLSLPRAGIVARCSSAYFPASSYRDFHRDEFGFKQWHLAFCGSSKNRDRQLEAFFGWIDPYCDVREGGFLGYTLYEEDDEPQLFFKKSEVAA